MPKRETSKPATKQEREAYDVEWLKQCDRELLLCNSFERVDYLLGVTMLGRRPSALWFRLLGNWWDMCDGMGDCRMVFSRILRRATRRQLDAMMTDAERRRLAELPASIRAFRGCEADDHDGISFSLCERTARRFPFLNRYKANDPALIVADIPKDRAVLKLEREEQEIIACGDFTIIAVEILQSAEVAAVSDARRVLSADARPRSRSLTSR
jgi:hypothetical protein